MHKLVIIDPGLYEVGGHHAALLNTLAVKEREAAVDITIYSSLHIAEELRDFAARQDLNINPWFDSNFYQYFDEANNFKSTAINTFIRGLALEFKSAIVNALESVAVSDNVIFWYPCVNWEHANALSLALSQLAHSAQYRDYVCSHKVCSMFMSQQPENNRTNLPYETAFKRLNNCSQVEIYAADWELREYLEKLNVGVDGIHPCYLLPWSDLEIVKKESVMAEGSTKTFLLYMGDAKENKGFTMLPSLIKSLSATHLENVKLVVQYTTTWSSPVLEEAEQKLGKLAEQLANLEVHKVFWSVEELVRNLNKTDLIFCTYEPSAYQFKSSGLAWLASFFNTPVVLRGESWLAREFARLQHPFEVSPSLTYSTQLLEKNSSQKSEYRSSLFIEPIDWLYKN
ncbi:hypothetical protein MTsDn5_26280 [Alteromonas gracilis]|uniref:hypothetical protein n=1 Tax=Alteromonas gracilis TaxID=1479524 RepID=UPI0036F1FCA4